MHFPLMLECLYKKPSKLSSVFCISWGIRKIIAKNWTRLLGFINVNVKPVFITEEDIPEMAHILHPSLLDVHPMHINII